MKQKRTILVICILIGVGIFAFSKAVSFFNKNQSLVKEIDLSLKPQIMELQLESTKLTEDLNIAKESISNLERERTQIRVEMFDNRKELKETKNALAEKDKRLAKINKQIGELTELNKGLQERFGTVLAEYIKLKRVISSIDGLKKEISKLKKKQKLISKKTNRNINKRKRGWFRSFLNNDDSLEGNGGFLVRNGKSTFEPRVKITVTSVEGE